MGPKLNAEQKVAAINIIRGRNAPLPYLLFGPAGESFCVRSTLVFFLFRQLNQFLFTHTFHSKGTGKTRTLVAAIEEIIRSSDGSVLVCANSNSACDEIAERLLNVLNFGEMFRMYAKTYNVGKISKTIKPICNWSKHEFQFPSLKFLYEFRVLICTLSTAGCITRAYESSDFNRRHFSHIMIDECASTHETVTMIPIAGKYYNDHEKWLTFKQNKQKTC